MTTLYNLRVTNSAGEIYLMESETNRADAERAARILRADEPGINVDVITAAAPSPRPVTIIIKPEGRNIHDLADHCPREIKLGARFNYVVIAPAYYRMSPTRHQSEAAAIRRAAELRDYEGVRIIDRAGRLGRLQNCAGDRWIEYDPELDACVIALHD